MNDRTGKVLRTLGIIFFGLATLMNLLGGIGTSCAAFFTKQYPPYWALIKEDMQWLYQGLVITTVILGIVGIWVTVQLIRGKKTAFRNALIILVIGTILAGIQYYYSMQLFGKAAPANVKFFSNAFTLILFLVYLIPGIRERVNFSNNGGSTDKDTAGGLAAIVVGIILLTTPIWAGPSHTYLGENWVNLLQTPLYISGILLTGGGIALLMRVAVDIIRQEFAMADLKLPKDN
ncbi:MAG: hypothetical protein ABUK20_09700 [Anaerolineales bacterium]